MDLKKYVAEDFEKAIAVMPGIPSELRRSIRNHPRKALFFDNLIEQLVRIPVGMNFTRKHIREIVVEFTVLFVRLVKIEAEQKVMSDLKKSQMKADEQKAQVLDRAAEGKTEALEEYFDGQQPVIMTDSGVNTDGKKQ